MYHIGWLVFWTSLWFADAYDMTGVTQNIHSFLERGKKHSSDSFCLFVWQDIKTVDWSDNVAPFWPAVIRSALTWKGFISLLGSGKYHLPWSTRWFITWSFFLLVAAAASVDYHLICNVLLSFLCLLNRLENHKRSTCNATDDSRLQKAAHQICCHYLQKARMNIHHYQLGWLNPFLLLFLRI